MNAKVMGVGGFHRGGERKEEEEEGDGLRRGKGSGFLWWRRAAGLGVESSTVNVIAPTSGGWSEERGGS